MSVEDNDDDSYMIKFAVSELDRLGLEADGDINGLMRSNILDIVSTFARQGHSGFSAKYALSVIERLLAFQPLSPLTGNDDEWNEVGPETWQNRRYSSVFKEADGKAYDIDAVVFWEYLDEVDDEGKPFKFKSYFMSRESRREVSFPYTPPNKPTYIQVDCNQVPVAAETAENHR